MTQPVQSENTAVLAPTDDSDKALSTWFAAQPRSRKEQIEIKKERDNRAAARHFAMGNAQQMAAQGGTLGQVMTSDLTCLPAALPATRTRSFPMNEDTFGEDFGTDFSIIAEGNVESTGFVNKFTTGGGVTSPFILRSICIVARVDPMGFAVAGGAVPIAAVGTAPGAAIAPRVPAVVPPTGTGEYAGMRPGLFEYGHAGWQAFVSILRAYRFLYVLNNRLLMINERAIDMGVTDSGYHLKGFGTSQIDPMPHVREANAHFREIGAPYLFVPSNVTEYDTVANGAAALPPALTDVQYASPCAPGVYGACFPVTPHVLFPGQQPQLLFSRTGSDADYEKIRQAFLGTGQSLPDAAFAGTNVAATAPPIYLGHVPFRYGTLELGIMMRGAELVPADCLAWFLMFGQPYESILRNDTSAWNALTNMATGCGLAGIPKPLGPAGVDPRWNNESALGVLFKNKIDEAGNLAGFEAHAEPGENFVAARKEALKSFAVKGYLLD